MRARALLACAGLGGCAAHVPDPAPVAREFARACVRGDATAVRRLLGKDEQRAIREDVVRKQLADPAFAARCRALARDPLRTTGTATLQFAGGETATLVLEDGVARVAAAGALPGGGGTPEAALASFRSALLQWLDGGALGPLTTSTRRRSDAHWRALAEGLERPERLLVQVDGDRAKVDVEPGHFVALRREGGLWRVEDFE